MSGYRDEKETLRRRVAALEAELERATSGDESAERESELEADLRAVRSERDELARERARLEVGARELEGELERVVATTEQRLAKAHRELATKHLRYRFSFGVLVGMLISGALLAAALGSVPWIIFAALTAAFTAAAAWGLLRASPKPKPFDPSAEPAPERRKKKRKQRIRARVDVERHEVAMRAKSAQRRRR